MPIRFVRLPLLPLAAALLAGTAGAQERARETDPSWTNSGPGSSTAKEPQRKRKASEAAQAFTLDLDKLPVDEAVTTGVADTPAPEVAVPPVPTAATGALFSLDTPIEQLIADPRAKAVLDKDLPGLSDDKNLPRFRAFSLRSFQPLTGGQLTDALLDKTATDLAAIQPEPSEKPKPSAKKRLDSR